MTSERSRVHVGIIIVICEYENLLHSGKVMVHTAHAHLSTTSVYCKGTVGLLCCCCFIFIRGIHSLLLLLLLLFCLCAYVCVYITAWNRASGHVNSHPLFLVFVDQTSSIVWQSIGIYLQWPQLTATLRFLLDIARECRTRKSLITKLIGGERSFYDFLPGKNSCFIMRNVVFLYPTCLIS